jgi:hypothetical protein
VTVVVGMLELVVVLDPVVFEPVVFEPVVVDPVDVELDF